MEEGSGSGEQLPGFSSTEMMELESVFKDLGNDSLNKDFCMEIANGFSCTRSCGGEPVIKWEQVQNWFQDKQMKMQEKTRRSSSSEKLPEDFSVMELEAKPASPSPSKKILRPSAGSAVRGTRRERCIVPTGENHLPIPGNDHTIHHQASTTTAPTEGPCKIALDLKEMMYEAQSAKEYAWYDVAYFRNFRYGYRTGDLEVLVRFKGFDRLEDEWINVKRQVRQRSVPLVPSECNMVNVGDHVMCHRVNDREALYYDARVINIQRSSHDTSSCSCVFKVRYVHDSVKEKVTLEKLCVRPR